MRVSAAGQIALAGDAELGALLGDRAGQADDAGLGGRVVALADRALEGVGGEVDDAAMAGLAHVLDRVMRHVPVALEVHTDDRIEIVFRHVPDHLLAQHAGHVHENVDLAVVLDAAADHGAGLLVVGDRVVVRLRLAAGRLDLRNHVVGGAFLGGFTAAADARIVDDDACAFLGEQERDVAADAAPCAGDDRRFALEMHGCSPCWRIELSDWSRLPLLFHMQWRRQGRLPCRKFMGPMFAGNRSQMRRRACSNLWNGRDRTRRCGRKSG